MYSLSFVSVVSLSVMHSQKKQKIGKCGHTRLMPRSSNASILSSSSLSVSRELENLLSPAPQTLRVRVEGESIAIIDIAFSSKMEHNSTAGREGSSTGVISTGVIPIHHIRAGDGNGNVRGNADDADNIIVSSSSSSYWGRTTKLKKEEILQKCVVCVKSKRGPKGSRGSDIHHTNATKALS